jgi:uncharacterized membrane protein
MAGDVIDPGSLPPEARRIVQAIIAYQGPLPPSSELEKYEQIVPGAASRILGWVDEERHHRHSIVAQDSKTRTFQTIAGMIFGFIVTMTGILGAIYLAVNGHEDTAKVLGGFTLAAIAAVFVTGRLIRVGSKP